MAGFTKIYCVGGLGGYDGADGINPILFQILVGDGNRQWLEVHYFDKGIKPIVEATIIPEGPDNPDSLVDACILFFPSHFRECSLLEKVASELKKNLKPGGLLDFDLGKKQIPRDWLALREQARPCFKQLAIFQAALEPYPPAQ